MGDLPQLFPWPDGDSEPLVEPIAICGMGMRLPGGIRDAAGYWDLLYNKKSGRCKVPESRYNVDAWHGPGKLGHVANENSYFLQEDLRNGDASFWAMMKNELEAADPQQRLTLEVTYECLQSAGQIPKDLKGKRVGVYVGSFEGDWLELDGRDVQTHHTYRLTGYGDYMVANRIHYEFGFMGPSVTTRTACSASLTSLHHACKDILAGDCDSAVVATANIIMSPRTTITMTELGVMSPTGSCKTFDAAADGYARGEAVSAIYIKKLSDAIRDGDPVRSVIRSTCINAGGRSSTLTAPNAVAHEALMRRGHKLAGINTFAKTAMIECHGTGTQVGDPIETTAVASVFGEHGIYIGSVKPNLGHSEGASGLSSIIKMTLALENKTIPPNILFNNPNPKILFKEAKLVVPTEPLPWPEDRAELVGVNSFGVGGSNAHVLLGSAESFGLHQSNPQAAQPTAPKLLLFSARHSKALAQSIWDHEAYYKAHTSSLPDISYSLALKREVLSHASYVVTDGIQRIVPSREQQSSDKLSSPPKLVFAFTGQGAQWPQMGQALMLQSTTFRSCIDNLDAVLQRLPDAPGWTLVDALLAPKETSRLSEAEISQPCCTAVQIALVDALREYGVKPDAVVGHSSGEIAAAYASGAISAADAIRIAFYRGLMMTKPDVNMQGCMAAIGLGADDVKLLLETGCVVGCENSPASTTITGNKLAVEKTMDKIRVAHPDVLVRALRVDKAYHSPHMELVAQAYLDLLTSQSISATHPHIPFYSSVTGQLIDASTSLGPSYWVSNLVSPVLFSTAITNISTTLAFPKTFLELGPHSALAGPIREILRHVNCPDEYTQTLVRGQNSHEDLLRCVGELWLQKVPVNLNTIAGTGRFLPDLPLYPWQYDEPLWIESRLSRDYRQRQFPHHDILGSRVIESLDANPCWRNILRLDSVPWIKEHVVGGSIVFPGVGYVCMAAEAIRQLTGSVDFTVRRVNIKSALVLHEGAETEVITQLERLPLNNALDSKWYKFSIHSLSSGGAWTKHVFGQVSAGPDKKRTAPDLTPAFARQLDRRAWYKKMRKMGLSYGPRFTGLKDMTAHPAQTQLRATITNASLEGESLYAVHPATLDCLLQAFGPAAFSGLTRRYDVFCIPTYIAEMYVCPPQGADLLIQVDAEATNVGSMSGGAVAVCAGQTVVSLEGVQTSKVDDIVEASEQDQVGSGAAELVWKEDLNLKLSLDGLVQPAKDRTALHAVLDEFANACMRATAAMLAGLPESEAAHFNQFRNWLVEYAEKLPKSAHVDDDVVSALIEDLYARLRETEASPTATAIYRIYKHASALFAGSAEVLEVLLEDDVLHDLYDFMQNSNYEALLDLAAHRKPNMRILEIGAGTGGTTATVLPSLKSAYGERMYSSYVYTDISAGFFGNAKKRFEAYPGLEFAVLDISQDPESQGFELGSFDLVIACNVLHATPVLQDTLRNVRKLLHPQGRLFLQELAPATKWINFVMGTLPGWWLGEADNRFPEPYVSADVWDVELKKAGFAGAALTSYDGYLNNNIVTLPQREEAKTGVTLLHSKNNTDHVAAVSDLLQQRGYQPHLHALESDGPLPPAQDVVSLLDLGAPFLHDLQESQLSQLQALFTGLHSSERGIFWVTGAGQVRCTDPRYGMISGLVRVIRNELRVDFATLELQNFGEAALAAIPDVFAEFQQRIGDGDANTSATLEWAYDDGKVLISRYHYIQMDEELLKMTAEKKTRKGPSKLVQERAGLLNSLHWREQPEASLSEKEVRVRVEAVGLNFKDILLSQGYLTDKVHIGRGLGCEASGVVIERGSAVTALEVGDRVMSSSCGGTFTTAICLDHRLCITIPDKLTFAEAATMPVVVCTSIYGLLEAGKLKKGDSVLIHSATGGVGLAAMQIAQNVGATIYATVGSEEKVQYLVDHFNQPRERIFHSRTPAFLQDIMEATSGQGVDLVLNTLAGDLLHASWACVAEFGTMVEIGLGDIVRQGMLDMEPFGRTRTFTCLDFAMFCAKRPDAVQKLLQQMIDMYEKGWVTPITPVKTYPAAAVTEAFRFMQSAQHIGKIVIEMPSENVDGELRIQAVERAQPLQLRSDAAYLFVGGLGGLGQGIATWLVERGARHLVFLSRTAGSSSEAAAFQKELAELQCETTLVSGDVTKMEDVERAVKAANKPIAGVLQASMVLRDASFVDMTWQDWQAAVHPKVAGTWNLHRALLSEPLDFFFLFSSTAAVSGQNGQANYNAGNTFQDAFVTYRHSLGLPASVVDIGIIEDVGYVSKNPTLLDSLRATSQALVQEVELLSSVELALRRSRPVTTPSDAIPTSTSTYVNKSQIALGLKSTLPITAPNNRTPWRRDPRMLVYRNLEDKPQETAAASNSSDEAVSRFLREASASMEFLKQDESAALLANEIGRTLLGFLMKADAETVDVDAPLAAVGIDSLVSIELRNWLRRKVGVEFAVLEITGAVSLRALGKEAQGKLVEKFQMHL